MDLGSDAVEKRTFPVKRRGYDRGEVLLYLHHVANMIADLEEAARAAELRIGELERSIYELLETSENGFHQAVSDAIAAGVTMVPEPVNIDEETRRVLSAAADHATRLREKAEVMVEDALSTTEQIEENQVRLLDAAKANRDLLLTEAHEEAEQIIAQARETAAITRSDAQRFAEELRELTAAETIELVAYAKAMAAAILETAGGQPLAIELAEDVTIDLRESAEEPSEPDVEWSTGLGGGRPSRYESRSAKLPEMGDESAGSALESIENLREGEG